MQTATGGPIYWLRKRLYNNIEPFGYNDVGSRLIDAVVLNKNEHDNFKGDYLDIERAPALYLTIDNIWGEYLHIPENERRYSNGKYKIKNNGNGTFSLPFESMEDIMQAVNSNNPLLLGLRGKLGNSVVGEYDVHRGYDKNGDYLKYIDHWRINPYDVKDGKDYGLDNNLLLKWYFKGKDDVSFGLGTPVEIQGKYYLDDIYNIKGKDRGGHYLPEVVVTGKKKRGGKMNAIEQFKQGHKIHIKKKNRGKFTAYCGGNVTSACIAKAKASGNPTLVKRATFAANARKWKHKEGGIIKAETGLSTSSFIDPMIVDYIKAIENPDKVGWNGKIWKAPGLKGYDLNLRGYGIDINTNNAARKLTAGRQGQWLTDDEANTLMLDHIRYVMNAANKHIKGFGELPIGRKAALLGMLYRGDSVNKSNINITEPDDTKFFNSIHNYYISKGLKERAANSSKFLKSYENSNKTTLNFNFNNYKDLNYPFKYIQ